MKKPIFIIFISLFLISACSEREQIVEPNGTIVYTSYYAHTAHRRYAHPWTMQAYIEQGYWVCNPVGGDKLFFVFDP